MAQPQISIIMGSDSDFPIMKEAITVCEEFGIPYEVSIISAHRTPELMFDYAKNVHLRGIKVIISGCGLAAHLPGMVASLTPLPVIGIPMAVGSLQGIDSLYSIVQMPQGVPVATVAIGNGRNAGLLAVQILAIYQPELTDAICKYRQTLVEIVKTKQENLDNSRNGEYPRH